MRPVVAMAVRRARCRASLAPIGVQVRDFRARSGRLGGLVKVWGGVALIAGGVRDIPA